MVNNQEIISTILSGIETLAKGTFGNAADSAKKDAKTFLDSMQEDLIIWTDQLAKGIINEADLKFQIESKKDLVQMKLMENAGIAKIKVDEFKTGVINIVCSSILSKIGL